MSLYIYYNLDSGLEQSSTYEFAQILHGASLSKTQNLNVCLSQYLLDIRSTCYSNE